ncbi:protein translocase subunit SecF [Patescibacteria group bacterium]|nr:protein translocase subunit SecF [Patescibacteria group bacterium]
MNYLNIMKFRPLFYALSGFLIALSLFSIAKWGFRPSIDFKGGTIYQIKLPHISDQSKVVSVFRSNNIPISSISSAGENAYLVKFINISQPQKLKLDESLKKLDKDFQSLQFETLGPSLGKELLQKTLFAVLLSAIALLVFIGTRFSDFTFGTGAIVAMFHDAIILIGSFSLLGHFLGAELDALFVTALLTTLSASVHDTVVTFDRIRELKRQKYQIEWVELVNQAVTETIVRSFNTSMTVVIMLFALVVLGGSTTRWFALALLIGVVCGTYSSTGVAIPVVLALKKWQAGRHSKTKNPAPKVTSKSPPARAAVSHRSNL